MATLEERTKKAQASRVTSTPTSTNNSISTLEERTKKAQASRVTSTPTSTNQATTPASTAKTTTTKKSTYTPSDEVIAERAQRSRDTWVQEDSYGTSEDTTKRVKRYTSDKNTQKQVQIATPLLTQTRLQQNATKKTLEGAEPFLRTSDDFDKYAESGRILYERQQQKKQNQQKESGFSTEAAENKSVPEITLDAMTNDERKMYYYKLAKDGQEAADNYMRNISGQVNTRLGQQEAAEIENMPSGLGKTLRYGFQSFMGGVDDATKGIAQAFTDEVYDPSQTAVTSGVLGSNLTGLKKNIYEAGHSIGNMLPAVVATILTEGVGAPAVLTEAASGLMTGLGAGGNAYGEAIKDGYSYKQATTYGMLIGASEAALEKLLGGVTELAGVGNVADKLLEKVAGIESGLARWALTQGVKIGAEINEEELQNFLEPLFRTVIFGEDYDAPTIQELVDTAITTAISTGIMNFGQTTEYNPDAKKSAKYDADATPTDKAMMDTLAGRETAENPNVTQETDLDRLMVETFQQNQKSNIDNAANNPYNKTDKGGVTDGHTDQLDGTSGTGVWERPDGYQSGRRTQDGTAYDGRGNLQLSGIVLLSPESQQTLAQRGIVNVGLHDSSTDNAAFSAALDAARAADQRNGWAVTPKSAEKLTQDGTKTYMSQNGSTGFAIARDGDIEAVFANKAAGAPKGATKSTIPQAIALGGNKLDCYGGGLVSIYSKYGFEPVARVAFNPEHANDGWTADKGSPDIYFMMHNGDSADTVVQNMDNYKRWSDADLEALPVMDYDTAYQYRDFLLEQRRIKPTAESSVGAAEAGFDPYSHALNEYGAIEAGENPARVVDVPKSTDGKNKVSKFVRTAMEASITPDEMVTTLEQMVTDGTLTYQSLSNKQALEDAVNSIVHDYERGKTKEQIRSEFVRDALNERGGARFAARGIALYTDALAEGNQQAAAEIATGLQAINTTGGQTIQIARLLKKMTPEGRIFTAQRMISNLEAQINKTLPKKKQIELDVDNDLIKAYGDAKTEQAQQEALGKIYDQIAPQVPTTLAEGLQQWRYFSMLFNPSTHLKNIGGNVGGYVAKTGKDVFSTLGEEVVIGDVEKKKVKTAENVVKKYGLSEDLAKNVAEVVYGTELTGDTNHVLSTLAKSKEAIQAISDLTKTEISESNARMGINEVWKANQQKQAKRGRTKAFLNLNSKADRQLLELAAGDYEYAADTYDTGSKYGKVMNEINSRRRIWKLNDPKTKLGKGVDTVLKGAEAVSNFNSTALEVEDMWFSKPQYTTALAGYMKANHLTEITDAARKYAMTEAKRGTFNDLNTVSKWASKLGGNTRLGKLIASIPYPFKKVPANVMVRTVEYSPLGLIKGGYELTQLGKENFDVTVAQVIDTFGASASGTVLLGVGYMLAKSGLLRATGVGDEKEKEQQKSAFGAKDFSFIASNGKYIPIDSFTLAGTGLLTGAQIYESIQNMKNGDGIDFASVLDALSKITDPVFEQSMLTGVSDIIRTIQYSGTDTDLGELGTKIGIQMVGNYLGQYIPTVVGRIASSLDTNQRSTYVEPDGAWSPIQTATQTLQKKIPWAREKLMPTLGNWGVEIEGNGANGVLSAIGNAITPIYTSEAKSDPVEEEIARLYKADSEYSNFYSKPKKYFSVDGETVKLTSEQYDKYVAADGQTDYNVRTALLNDNVYKNVPDSVKSKAMELSAEYANEIGKVAAGVGYEINEKWVQDLEGKSDEEIANAILGKAIDSVGGLTNGAGNFFSGEKYSSVPTDVSDKAQSYADQYAEAMAKQELGYDVTTKWVQEAASLSSDEERADYFTLKASSDTGTKLANQESIATMQKQLSNPVYTGMSADIMDSANEIAAEYYEAIAKEQYGKEPEKWVTEAKGMSEKELADLFVEKAVSKKLNQMEGGKYDDLNTLYDSGDINEATVVAALPAEVLDKWAEYGKGNGVSVGDVLDMQQFYNSDAAKGEKDENGKDIKGKKKQDKVIAWIDSKDLTNQQKDAWFCCLYSAKNSPWKWAR